MCPGDTDFCPHWGCQTCQGPLFFRPDPNDGAGRIPEGDVEAWKQFVARFHIEQRADQQIVKTSDLAERLAVEHQKLSGFDWLDAQSEIRSAKIFGSLDEYTFNMVANNPALGVKDAKEIAGL